MTKTIAHRDLRDDNGSLLFNPLPANVIGEVIDQVFDVGGFDTTSAGAATDVATSAASTSATPDEVIGQAITDLNQGATLLDAAPTADLSTWQADFLLHCAGR